jgi:DNA-binding NtrC family response regulator
VGRKYHALLLHSGAVDGKGGTFVELSPDTPHDLLRAILFSEDRRLLEGRSGKPLPKLEGRATVYLRDVHAFGRMDQNLLSRFLIEQEQRVARPVRLVASTPIPWQELLQRLQDSFAQGVRRFGLCRIPPLRERLDEIPSLIQEILGDHEPEQSATCWRVTKESIERLKTRYWRDNVRELKYVVEEAAAKSPDGVLKFPENLSDEIDLVSEMSQRVQSGRRIALDRVCSALEKGLVQRALIRCNFDQRQAARLLEMTEPNLLYRVKKFSIYIPPAK